MDRSWMYYNNLDTNGGWSDEFYAGVNTFINFALSNATGSEIRCPCSVCANQWYLDPETVRGHLYRKGFTQGYFNWICHGESCFEPHPSSIPTTSHDINQFPMIHDYSNLNPHQRMIFDAAGPNFIPFWNENMNPTPNQFTNDIPSSSNPYIDPNTTSIHEEPTNVSWDEQVALSEKFYDALKVADSPLYAGCEEESQLSSISGLLAIKSEFNMSENNYNRICEWVGNMLPQDHTFPSDYYQTNKIVKGLGLPLEKIDMCPKGCMLYWKDDEQLQSCKFCNRERYKCKTGNAHVPFKQLHYLPLIPRLQRLYASPVTAASMRWHNEHVPNEEGMMSHPSHSEAWKHFDRTYPDFAYEARNVRLALCSDGFAPFGKSGRNYSCWPVIVTPYNLPPSMCLKTPYMFLSMIIPGPRNPKKLIDICLQPLIEELKLLWTEGVPTFDISKDEYFLMRAALLWTTNDFPAYGMLSGWSTAGLMACPYCMEDIETFWLTHSKKPSWFDVHRRFTNFDHPFRRDKKSFCRLHREMKGPPRRLTADEIWDRVKDLPTVMEDPHSEIEGYLELHKWTKQSIFWQLPYWKTNLIHHNLDVMHIEKNAFDNVFNTMMDIKGKSKDTLNARKDIKLYCDRPELAVDEDYSGPKPKAIYTVTKDQRKQICEWITTLKFPDGYVSNLGRCVQMDEYKLIGMKSHDCHIFMQRLIPIAFKEMLPESVWGPLTELSQFFQSLFSPTLLVAQMEELERGIPLILCKLERIFPPSFFDSMEHLLVHLPFEAKIAGPVQYRWMYPFERFMHNLKEKLSNPKHIEASICSRYINEEIATFGTHYFEPKDSSRRKKSRKNGDGLSNVVDSSGSIFDYPGQGRGKSRTRWLDSNNELCAIEAYILRNCDEVEDYVKEFFNQFGGADDSCFDANFTSWFKSYVRDPSNNVNDEFIQSLAWGPKKEVLTWSAYYINGYTFHTLKKGEGKSTMNSGVWVKGSNYSDNESDYYGLLEEIIQVEYPCSPPRKIVLFKCRWFNPIDGMYIHPKYDLAEVNHKRLYRGNDLFIFAQQAIQVYYASYPGARRDRVNWWAACKIKARSTIEQRWTNIEEAYQPEIAVMAPTISDILPESLLDPSGVLIDDESASDDASENDDHDNDDNENDGSHNYEEGLYEEESDDQD